MLLEQHPARITIAGRPHWVFADGTRLPVISGGSDDPPPPAPPQADPPPPEFRAPQTQEEFDRMIGPRLQRERDKFAGYDDYKAAADELAALRQQNESDVERLQRERDEAVQQATAMSWTAAESSIRSAVTAAASSAGAVDVDAVYALIDKNAVTLDDAGRVTGAEAAVQQLLDVKPYLKGAAAPPPNFDSGARGDGAGGNTAGGVQQLTRDDLKTMSPDEIVAAKAAGRLVSVLGQTP